MADTYLVNSNHEPVPYDLPAMTDAQRSAWLAVNQCHLLADGDPGTPGPATMERSALWRDLTAAVDAMDSDAVDAAVLALADWGVRHNWARRVTRRQQIEDMTEDDMAALRGRSEY